jgi:UDP-N-acetylglucosamine/UDP-N-acetylgalactosamine 4-epimerase
VGLHKFASGNQRKLDAVLGTLPAAQAARFRMLEGDVADPAICGEAWEGVAMVLQNAALGSVPRSIEDPLATNRANVDGCLAMLVAARDAGVERCVYAASSSTYGDSPHLPKVEERIGRPLSPYAVTKYVNELYAEVFSRCYGLSTIGLRYFNVFGRRQDPDGAYAAVIARLFGSLVRGDTVYIKGDGETSRDFCFVDNAVQANILAGCASHEAGNRVYNVAFGERTTLNQLFELIREQVGARLPEAERAHPVYREFRSGDVRHSLADVSQARELLGYAPQFRLKAGLVEAAKWYLAALEHE